MLSASSTLARVSEYFRGMICAREESLRVPLFSLLIDKAAADLYRNYAYPDDGAAPDPSAVSRLIDAFEQRGRTPRLEYIPELAPALEQALSKEGFVREGELPLMKCTPDTLQLGTVGDGVVCHMVADEAGLLEAANVQNAAYGLGAATSADVDRLRKTVAGGGLVGLARAPDGLGIGSGLVSAPKAGVAEVAAVGVLSGHRRQGVGAGITAFLTGRAFDHGIDLPFLMAAHEDEARMYRGIGFAPFATMLHMARGSSQGCATVDSAGP